MLTHWASHYRRSNSYSIRPQGCATTAPCFSGGSRSSQCPPASFTAPWSRLASPRALTTASRCLEEEQGYVEPLMRLLGSQEIRSIDTSAFENATDIHDLNDPLPANLHAQFSAVIDSGTIEHVFNLPQALKNAMELVALDGHLVLISPTNNDAAHGFYQLSPELLFRSLGAENGFEIESFLIREDRGSWYEVIDPLEVGAHAEFRSRRTTYLYVIARRKELVPVFRRWPQQSDYVTAWSGQPVRATSSLRIRAITSSKNLARAAR